MPTRGPVHRWLATALLGLSASLPGATGTAHRPQSPPPRGMVVLLTDDQGPGDLSNGPHAGRFPTPHLDRLAREGRWFTDAHSGSAVCTPTRYGLLTGRHAWRSRLQKGVLGGLSPSLIPPDRLTLPAFLKQHGWRTALVGKWHLGLDWEVLPGQTVNVNGIESRDQAWNVDFTRAFTHGPLQLGFDTFFGISASLDMVPYAWLDGDRVAALPTLDRDFIWSADQPGRRTRTGPAATGFDPATVLHRIGDAAVDWLEHHSSRQPDQPFFLCVAFASPHTPILPSPAWQGRSGINAYADFVMETDAVIGRILETLDACGLADDTLVWFASDNGCSPEADLPTLAAAGHLPGGPYRGHKADLFEGGHRVPMIVRWPGRVPPGTTYAHPVCLTDLMATCADLLQAPLPVDAAGDSTSLLPALVQARPGPVRSSLIHHSINGSFAIRQGPWKLLLCPDSGGWSAPRPGSPGAAGLPPVQLYNLQSDPGETVNRAMELPGRVREMALLLEQQVRNGRSTPGPPRSNDVPVDPWGGRPHPVTSATPGPAGGVVPRSPNTQTP